MKPLLTILCCLFTWGAHAQELSTFPIIPFTDFGEFDVDGDRIIALGSCDQVWYTSDAGLNWSYVETPESFYDVKFLPNDIEQRAILSGSEIYLFDFENGFVQDFIDEPLFDVSNSYRNVEVNNSEVFIVGPDQILRADIDEFEWTEIYLDTFQTDYLYTSELLGEDLYIGCRYGNLIKVNTNSYDWELMQNFGSWIYTISMGTDEVGYISTSGIAEVLKTTDGWNSYAELPNMPERIQPIAFGEDVVITVNTNRIYLSTDGGESATYIKTANTREFSLTTRALFLENGDLYFSGRGAMMTKSTDYGMSWTPLNPYNRSNLRATNADDNGNVVIVGDNSTFYTSEDDGKNWMNHTLDFPTGEFFKEAIVLGSDKYLISSDEHIMIVENDEVLHSFEASAEEIVVNDSLGYMIGLLEVDGNYEVHKSLDQGITWTKKFDVGGYSRTLTQSSTGKLYVRKASEIFSSIDDGENWEAESYDLSSLLDVRFWDDNFGLVVSSGKLFRTTDAGQTFEEISSGYAIKNLTFLSKDHFFFTTASNNHTTLRMTEDGGENFEIFYTNCATTNAITVNGKNELILAQRDGHVQVVPLKEEMNPSAVQSNMDQITFNVFPNPLSTSQLLSIEGTWDVISIFSVDGKMVFSQDYFSNKIDLSNLPPGMYFLEIRGKQGRGVQELMVN